MSKPLIIYVSGPPGSGKSTLAEKISREFHIPHVSSDLVHGGSRMTAGEPIDRKKSLHEVYVPLMIWLAKSNVSFVVDHVLQKEMSKTDIIDKLTPFAEIVYIHLKTEDPVGRHLARELVRTDRGNHADEAAKVERADFHRNNLAQTEKPLDLGLPVIEINTSDGYEPSFESIIAFIESEYEKVRK